MPAHEVNGCLQDLRGEPARLSSNFFRGIKSLPVSISERSS